jgi:hypothetical protein
MLREEIHKMKDGSGVHGIAFNCPALYRIIVQGAIAAYWSDRLEGLSISQQVSDDGERVTTLEGELEDQAALAGVLNSVYELHLPILSVKCLDV